ncbi:MAG: HAMP domain-containing histidine kinase [Acidobacteria bacterium]|nr:HAMP domain-containing histidine kinase [Acidobacteriota bacterium]
MKRPRGLSLETRVVAGTVVTSILTSLLLATMTTVFLRVLWAGRAAERLEVLAEKLASQVLYEANEHGSTAEEGARRSFAEATLAGERVECWRGTTLVAEIPAGGERIGPELTRSGWVATRRSLPDGLVLVVGLAMKERVTLERLVLLALAGALPVGFLFAVLVGRRIARRATQPLAKLRSEVARLPPGLSEIAVLGPGAPREVQELEAAFRALAKRLAIAFERETAFAANASHELRTPLTRMRLLAETLGTRASSADDRAVAERLVVEIDRLAELTNTLLLLARDESSGVPRGEAVNLADLLRDTAADVFAGDARQPVLTAEDEALVRGDEGLLHTAVENLLVNARKFTPEGRVPEAYLERRGEDLLLTVVSPGVRIAEDEKPQVFDRFFRGASVLSEGHGLGLALARHVARLHGGDLVLEDSPAFETRFRMSLPGWKPGPASREHVRPSVSGEITPRPAARP